MEQDINKLIEELIKVRPDKLSTEGLKLFNKINEIIDKNKELEEENKIIKGNYYTLCVDIQMVTSELGFPEDTIIADEMVSMIKENYIPVSLVEEKIEELIKEGVEKGKLEGRQEGRQEGRLEGRLEGIQAMVRTCKRFHIDKKITIENIMKEFQVPEEEAAEYVKKYW